VADKIKQTVLGRQATGKLVVPALEAAPLPQMGTPEVAGREFAPGSARPVDVSELVVTSAPDGALPLVSQWLLEAVVRVCAVALASPVAAVVFPAPADGAAGRIAPPWPGCACFLARVF
jgi:hypothetical protein